MKSAKVLSLLKAHEVGTILGFRFIYGLRTVTPFLIGAVGITPARFIPLNALGGIAWAFLITAAGHLLGNVAEQNISDIKKYEHIISILILVVGLSCWIGYLIKKRYSRVYATKDSSDKTNTRHFFLDNRDFFAISIQRD